MEGTAQPEDFRREALNWGENSMETVIRALCIAPYEGMKTLMASLAACYPQMELTLFVGDRQQGLEIARSHFHGDFDVVISRGGTAGMLRENLPLPVVEIEVSMYDILCTLKLAGGFAEEFAIVATRSIASDARALCELMGYRADVYQYSDSGDEADEEAQTLEEAAARAGEKPYRAILCDMGADTVARRMGLNSFLIASSAASIRKAFDQAILLFHSRRQLRDENLFFRELLRGQIGKTLVFERSGGLFLSTLDTTPPGLMELLRHELPESQREPERKFIRALDGMLYSIRSRQIRFGDSYYTAFFLEARKAPVSPNLFGVRFLTRPEVEAGFSESVFSFFGTDGQFQQDLQRFVESDAPIVIAGEDGTGKETVASAIYLRSRLRNNPLVAVNCRLLNEKSWVFLLEHHNSPLTDAGCVLYFSSIDVLPPQRRGQLLAILSEMNVCRRNRVVFSCVCQRGESITEAGSLFLDKLHCLYLYLPALRQVSEHIPALVNQSLSRLNADRPSRIIGVEPEGLVLLQKYDWPHNYTQFSRVIEELAVTCGSQTVTEETVQRLLRKERHTGTFWLRGENTARPLDLNRTMEEINRDIARRVVAEAEGNQTEAAKRLGISRTTLWRLLQK